MFTSLNPPIGLHAPFDFSIDSSNEQDNSLGHGLRVARAATSSLKDQHTSFQSLDNNLSIDQVKQMLKAQQIMIGLEPKISTMLMRAAYTNHPLIVDTLLNMGVDINHHGGSQNSTALMEAAIHGSVESLNALLRAKADIEARDQDGWTALMYAALNGEKRIVTRLLEMRAAVDSVNNEGDTALALAAKAGHTDIVKNLLRHHARPDTVNKTNSTPLIYAAIAHHVDVIPVLLEAGAKPNVINYQALIPLLCSPKESDTYRLLILHGANAADSLIVWDWFISEAQAPGWVWKPELTFEAILSKAQTV